MPRKTQKQKTKSRNSFLEKINAIENLLNQYFVGRENEIEALLLSLITKQNAILIAPAGTAKTSLIKKLSKITSLRYWRHTFSSFDEKSDILGALDPIAYEKGELRYIYTGIVDAQIVHLDELFRASGVVRDLLLEVIEERTIDGKNTAVITALGTTNFLSDEPEDQALLDRFSIRVFSSYLPINKLGSLLRAGLLNLQNGIPNNTADTAITPQEIDSFVKVVIQEAEKNIGKVLDSLQKFYSYLESQHRLVVSDRRKIRIFLLGQAYALWRQVSIHHGLAKVFEYSIPKDPSEISLIRDAINTVEFFPVVKQIRELLTLEHEVQNYINELDNIDLLTVGELRSLLAKIISSVEEIINKLKDYKDPELRPYVNRVKKKIDELFDKFKEVKEGIA